MKLRLLLISLSLVLFAWQNASAQLAPADDFFNGGAQLYISNNIPAALEKVETGLKMYPDDEKLKKLEQLLKQQQKQNQQQQNQKNQQQNQDKSKQDQKQQPSKDDQKKDQQNQSQQQKDQQKQEDQKQQDAAKKKDEQPKNQEQQKAAADKKDNAQKEPAQPAKPGEMTPEEAKQLLDAQKGNEQMLPMKPDGKPRDSSKPLKDW